VSLQAGKGKAFGLNKHATQHLQPLFPLMSLRIYTWPVTWIKEQLSYSSILFMFLNGYMVLTFRDLFMWYGIYKFCKSENIYRPSYNPLCVKDRLYFHDVVGFFALYAADNVNLKNLPILQRAISSLPTQTRV
jgi:hypothetical protein